MLYQNHRPQILLQQDCVIQRYCDVAGKRYKAGEARQLEFLSADRMRNDNRLEMTKVKNEAENLQTSPDGAAQYHARLWCLTGTRFSLAGFA